MKDFFEKCDGKYDLIKIEYDLKKKNVVDKTKGVVVEMEPEEIKVPESKLHVQLQVGNLDLLTFNYHIICLQLYNVKNYTIF